MLTDEQVSVLLGAKDRVLHSALLFGLLTGMRSGEICGLMAEDITAKGNLGRFVSIRPNAVRLLKSKAAEREVPLHTKLEQLLDTSLPQLGRLFPTLSVDKVVKRLCETPHSLSKPALARCSTPHGSGSSPSVNGQGSQSTTQLLWWVIILHALQTS